MASCDDATRWRLAEQVEDLCDGWIALGIDPGLIVDELLVGAFSLSTAMDERAHLLESIEKLRDARDELTMKKMALALAPARGTA